VSGTLAFLTDTILAHVLKPTMPLVVAPSRTLSAGVLVYVAVLILGEMGVVGACLLHVTVAVNTVESIIAIPVVAFYRKE